MVPVIEPELRARAVRAAQGREPFDLLIAGGTVVDVATLELRPADLGIVGGMIASVHPRGSRTDARLIHDASGRFVAPGFIDVHVHFESSMMLAEYYAAAVVPQGTTTIFGDPHELGNVLGLDGVRYAIEASRHLPLRFIFQAPSSVPSAPGLEMSGADFEAPEIAAMLAWPEMAGVAEVMDMQGVLDLSPRVAQILAAALASGKLVSGHARGLSGASLQAYLAAGISSDHEIVSAEDGIEKLRAGMTVELRGSHDYILPGMVEALKRLPVIPTSLTVCTDDVFPDYLHEKGGVNDVIRRLIRYGLDPLQAIRCATINSALRLQRPDLGLVAAGRCADLVLLSDLAQVTVEEVFVAGRHAASGGRLLDPVTLANAAPPLGTVKLAPMIPDDFRVPVPGVDNGRALIRTIKGARFTQWSELEVEVRDGHAVVPDDLSVLVAMHRHGRGPDRPHAAILEDWGRWRGALATTYSHDSHNLVVFGHDPADMAVAANAVIAAGGGIAVVKEGRVIALLELPVAGILSMKPIEEVAREFKAVQAAADLIAEWKPPYRVFKAVTGSCLACNQGPHLTDLGLTDGTTREIVEALIRAA